MWTHMFIQFSLFAQYSNVGVLWQSQASIFDAFHSRTVF
jgi:hypothetical protein